MKQKPKAETLFPWLRNNLGKKALAPLTGTDARALQAAVQIIEHYAYDPCQTVLDAFRMIVNRMQPKCHIFAYHAIAHCMDWGHRAELWREAELPALDPHYYVRCAYEPGGSETIPHPASRNSDPVSAQ